LKQKDLKLNPVERLARALLHPAFEKMALRRWRNEALRKNPFRYSMNFVRLKASGALDSFSVVKPDLAILSLAR